MKKLVLVFACLLPTFCFTQIIQGGYDFTNCDTIGFEDTTQVFIYVDTSAGNLWQIGNPNKTVFTAALGGNKALVTDTINTYSQSNTSSFILNWTEQLWNGNCNAPNGQSLIFIHSMNTNNLAGGYIEYSDDSVNWFNVFQNNSWGALGIVKVKNFSTPPQDVLPFTPQLLFNGELGFSGNFDADTFYIFQNYFPVKSLGFNPMLRFTFISDTLATSLDGWMIDQLVFGGYNVVGSVSESLSRSIKTYPNPAIDKLAFDIDEKQFKPTAYRITNIVGQQLSQGTFTAKPLDVATLLSGAYIITLTDAKGNAAAKVFYKQ